VHRSQTFQDVIEQACRRHGVPGMVVGVLDQDGTRIVHAHGVASVETGCPVRRDSLFQIGSITKVFLATLALHLVEAGRLELDTPVARYLPDLRLADPETEQRLTMRHLLTHTSGLLGDHFQDYGPADDALERYVADLHQLPQVHPLGRYWSYCNSGFSLAGRVIEVLTGQPFERAMQELVFEPLGLERTFFFAHEVIGYPLAVGHRTGDDGEPVVVRDFPLPRSVHPAGGITATIDDLLTFAAFHLGIARPPASLLSEASIAAMQRPQTTAANWAEHYGLGWALWSLGGTRLVGHGGSTNGFQAHLILLPEWRSAIASLTNHEGGSAAYLDVETWLLAERFGLRPARPPLVTISEADLARFAGDYRYPLAQLTVRPAPGGLWLDIVQTAGLSRQPRTRRLPSLFLRPIGRNAFLSGSPAAVPNRVDFLFDEGAEVPRWIRAFGRLAERVPECGALRGHR
jgi:CubicO group peptidase (beta-lactamase class C family)